MAFFDTLVLIAFASIALSLVWSHFRQPRAEEYPPAVPGFLPYISTSIQFVLNPSGFLWTCFKKYGPIFKVRIGNRQVTVISSPDSIAAILRDQHNVFNSSSIQIQLTQAVAGVRENALRLQEILHHQMSPLAGRTLAKTTVHKFSATYVERLLREMNAFVASSERGAKTVSLMEIVGRCRLAALCHAFFGPSFADDIYDDLSCMDASVYPRVYRIPFYWRPSTQARKRLIARLSAYISQAEEDSEMGDIMIGTVDIFKANKLAPEEMAWVLLVFVWGLYANSTHMTFWALTEVLADKGLAARLHEEVDNVLHTHRDIGKGDAPCTTDLPALLRTDAHVLDGLPLLDSVIQETIRLRLIATPWREAVCDTELVVDAATGQRVMVRKGEYVMAHLMGTHWDERWYEQANKFVPDRFMSGGYANGQEGTDGDNAAQPKRTKLPFFGWGGGREVCKGRNLATYEMKLMVALCVHYLHITHADSDKHKSGPSSANPLPPRAKKRSIAVQQTERDVMVRLNLTGGGN
ncbi:cytochrome P450 [Pisolithus thermaeus]|nr:cytochrome P450 [Pisolithus croceorrhizus]KAI6161130.1 cytochrome P450 [Pisolithus thermaeus]